MYGSNYYGKAYYAQGPAEGTTFTLHAITATATAIASVSFKLLINHAVSASVTAVASVSRQFNKTVSATMSLTATITTLIVEGLNIRGATTKFLYKFRTTNSLDGSNSTKTLNLRRTTRTITTDE